MVFCVKNRHFLKCAAPGKDFRPSLRPSILMGKPAQRGNKRSNSSSGSSSGISCTREASEFLGVGDF